MRLEYDRNLYDELIQEGFDDVGETDHDRLVYDVDGERRAEAWIDRDDTYTVLSIHTEIEDQDVYSVLEDDIEYVDLSKVLDDDPELEIQEVDTNWREGFGVTTYGSPKK